MATPVLCLLLLGIVQLAVVVRDQLRVIEAARIGARAASAAADPGTAAGSVNAVGAIEGARVSTSVHNGFVTVTVSATSATEIPLIGALLPDVEVSGSATMLLEPP